MWINSFEKENEERKIFLKCKKILPKISRYKKKRKKRGTCRYLLTGISLRIFELETWISEDTLTSSASKILLKKNLLQVLSFPPEKDKFLFFIKE